MGSSRSARLEAFRRLWPSLCTLRAIFPGSAAGIPKADTLDSMIRVLVALSPRMYREAVALSIHRNRPGLVDVKLVPPEAAEAELASFRPHLLIHNDARDAGRSGA